MFPPECELQLRVWQLHVLTQIELFTDDNFQFSRAAKTVREAIEGLPTRSMSAPDAARPKSMSNVTKLA